jgi:hypothetical protein
MQWPEALALFEHSVELSIQAREKVNDIQALVQSETDARVTTGPEAQANALSLQTQTLQQMASGARSRVHAQAFLHKLSQTDEKTPEPREETKQAPRIGVFLYTVVYLHIYK